MSLTLITPTQQPAVWWSDVSDHLRGVDDKELEPFLRAGIELIEEATGLQLMQATYEYKVCGFTHVIELPKPPVISVDQIRYLDSEHQEQTLEASSYYLAFVGQKVPATVRATDSWPTEVSGREESVIIRFTCGHPTSKEVPEIAKQLIKMTVSDLYIHREAQGRDMFENKLFTQMVQLLKVHYL